MSNIPTRYRALAGLLLAMLAPGSVGAATLLTVGKSGDDVVLSWAGGGMYDGARAIDAPFTTVTTQFLSLSGTSHTYLGGVSNSRTLEFFDVTDQTESNRGGNWNGGVLPPLPPAIDAGDPSTNIGDLFIGSTGVIVGSGFSSIPEVNTICFDGGVCTQATSSSPNQLQFVTPPGAYSGPVTVTVGTQTSEPASAVVALDDPTAWSQITGLTYSREDRSYWISGIANGVGSLYRLYFDPASGRWLRDDRAPTESYSRCSTQTSRTGRIFCSGGSPALGETETRFIDTNPPSTVQDCIVIDGTTSGSNIGITSSAVDPNPDGLRTNAAFFAVYDVGFPYRIQKVAHDCSAVLDDNYGNFATMDGARTDSMVVDPRNGDLYFAIQGQIWRITTSEVVSLVRADLPTRTRLEALTQQKGTGDPGTLLLTTFDTVDALALDNLNANPIPVATLPSSGTNGGFGAQVSGGPWLDANINRTVTVYRDETSLILAPHPLIDVTLSGPLEVRISSPKTEEEEQLPVGQSKVRPSVFGDTSFSHAITTLHYRDGLARNTCAKVGDPGPGAPQYDPSPTPANCNKPKTSTTICDNFDDSATNGPFTFVDTGGLTSCKTCGDPQNPCSWEFRITNRYSGDNYKVYFAFDQSAAQFAATSDVYTAWKHVHVERDGMCNLGGILFQDYGATGQCGGTGQPACCGPPPATPCDEIVLYSGSSNIAAGQSIVVFDEVTTYEILQATYENPLDYMRTVDEIVPNGDGSITLKLDGTLPYSVWASNRVLPDGQIPIFANGHSGGICFPAYGFAEADTSRLPDAFADGLISYHVPAYGLEDSGSGIVPYYSPVSFPPSPNAHACASERFSNIWFQNFVVGTDFSCDDPAPVFGCARNNYIHVIGALQSASGDLGQSKRDFNFSFVYVDDIALACNDTTDGCIGDQLSNYNRAVTRHEMAHQFLVNSCSTQGHDDPPRNAWCGELGGSCVTPVYPEQSCPMNISISSPIGNDLDADGVDRFCPQDLALGDPNCTGTPRDGAMRTVEDPQ